MGRPDTPFKIAYDFIKNNPKTTIGEAMRALGVSQFTVSKARNALVKEGILTKWSRNAHRPRTSRDKLHEVIPASDTQMTAEELHRVLSKAAREARDGAELRPIAAELIKLLPKPEQEESVLGPGPPAEGEEVERLGLMLEAMGPDLTMQAVEWAKQHQASVIPSLSSDDKLHKLDITTAEGTQSNSPEEPSVDHASSV